MIRVLLLSRYDRMGASSRLRFLQYIPWLGAKGIEVVAAPFFDDRYLSRLFDGCAPRPNHIARYYTRRLRHLLGTARYDAIWLEKEALPWLPYWLEYPWLQRLPYVLDLDDAWFHRYGQHPRSAVRAVLGDKLESIARRAAAVIVCSESLETWARDAGARRVVSLPTVVDVDHYTFQPPRRHEDFTIGWIGQPSTQSYVRGIEGALREVSRNEATSVRLVGAKGVDIPGVRVECRPWNERSEASELASFDVGIMPLENGPWEQGKCGYKLIQYMAAARPVVASRVGANTQIVRHGTDGFLVDTEREWIDALNELRHDCALRWRMGLAGRDRVAERFSVRANIDNLAQTLWAASG